MSNTGNNSGSIQLTTAYRAEQTSDSTNPWATYKGTIDPNTSRFEMYMRPQAIKFVAEGLKPNTRYYPFFNGVLVEAYCCMASLSASLSNDGMIAADTDRRLQTDINGRLVGIFYLPANTFVFGSVVFKLVDYFNPTTKKPDPVYGSAEAIFESKSWFSHQDPSVTNETVIEDITIPESAFYSTTATFETWMFEYYVTTQSTFEFSITNTSKIAPPASEVQPNVGAGSLVKGTITYLLSIPPSVSIINGVTQPWTHKYKCQVLNQSKKYQHYWTGLSTQTKPDALNFRPSGLLDNQTVTLVNPSSPWKKMDITAQLPEIGSKVSSKADALAQSFSVDAKTYPRGMFVTSIDIYFKSVDQSTPVVLQLREMTNGTPGSNILPSGTVVVAGQKAASSVDASVSTRFRFDHPIYLQSGKNYCFVLKSSSLGYNAWCSRVSDKDVQTGKVIDVQPYNGMLFKTQDNVSWVPEPYEDIKFNLFKADFDTTSDVALHFEPLTITNTNSLSSGEIFSTGRILPLSYISTVKDEAAIYLRVDNHGLHDNDKITITELDVDDVNGILKSAIVGTTGIKDHLVTVLNDNNLKIFLTGSGSTATKTGNLVVTESDVSSYPHVDVYSNSFYPNDVTPDLPIQAIPYVDPNNLSQTKVPTMSTETVTWNGPSVDSPNTFKVFTNIVAGKVFVDSLQTMLPNTSIEKQIVNLVSYNESSYSSATDVNIDDGFVTLTDQKYIFNRANSEMYNALTDPTEVVLTLSSSDKDLSPLVRVDAISLSLQNHLINTQAELSDSTILSFNDPRNSELGKHGSALAKYKSPIISFKDSYNALMIYISGICEQPAQFDVYVRSSTNAATHMDRPWVWCPFIDDGEELSAKDSNVTTFPFSASSTEVKEWAVQYVTQDTFVLDSDEIIGCSSTGTFTGANTTSFDNLEIGQQVAVTGATERNIISEGLYKVSDVTPGTNPTFKLTDWNNNSIETTAFDSETDELDIDIKKLKFEVTKTTVGLPFTVFDLKIVMRSSNTSIVPKIFAIRTIADNISE